LQQDLEGIGPTRSYYLDVADLPDAAPPPAPLSMFTRLGKTLSVAGAGMPYMLGLRRGRRTTAAV